MGLTKAHPLSKPEPEAGMGLVKPESQMDGIRTGCKNIEVRKTHIENISQSRRKDLNPGS